MKRIVILGGGLHAQVCIDIFEKRDEFTIVGIIDSIADVDSEMYGYKVIGKQENIVEIAKSYQFDSGFIAIGDNYSRKFVHDSVISKLPNFNFVNAIHPSVIIGRNVKMGTGIAMMAGVIVNAGSVIEDFCVLNTGSQLGHDCHMHDYTTLAGKSVAAAKVVLKKFAFVSLGVTILDRVTIGENALVGIGSLVLQNIPENVVAFGHPSKVVRTRELGEKFLNSK